MMAISIVIFLIINGPRPRLPYGTAFALLYIDWVNAKFTNYRKQMKGVEWGPLCNENFRR